MFNRSWMAAFGLFFALAAAWALASPLGSSPDEAAHMAWAAAASDGQLNPPIHHTPVTIGGVPAYYRMARVRVPEAVSAVDVEVRCYRFRANRSASCAEPLNGSSAQVTADTYASVYNPLYYALVGWPIHVVSGVSGMYLMRLMSAALCAALMACAASIARGVNRIAFAGVATAATPIALFLAGTVNPNGPEDAGGLLAWTALAALALDRRPGAVRRRVSYFALGAATLCLARTAGIQWLVLLLCVAVVLVPRKAAADLRRHAGVRLPLAALAVATALAELWNRLYGGLNLVPLGRTVILTVGHSLSASVHNLPAYTEQMIGRLGWLDTPAPFGTVAVWLGVVGLLMLAAFALADRRGVAVLLILLAGIVVLPIAANLYEARGLGNLWQGRYLLWWAVGLPVISAMVLAVNADKLPARLVRRMPVIVVAALAAGQLGMWWTSAIRYSTGLGGALWPSSKWQPPGGWIPATLLLLVGLAGMVLLAVQPRRSVENARAEQRSVTAAARPVPSAGSGVPLPSQTPRSDRDTV